MTAINRCRLLGSNLLIIGYFLVLYVDVKFGCTAFAVIDITKIIQLSF